MSVNSYGARNVTTLDHPGSSHFATLVPLTQELVHPSKPSPQPPCSSVAHTVEVMVTPFKFYIPYIPRGSNVVPLWLWFIFFLGTILPKMEQHWSLWVYIYIYTCILCCYMKPVGSWLGRRAHGSMALIWCVGLPAAGYIVPVRAVVDFMIPFYIRSQANVQ